MRHRARLQATRRPGRRPRSGTRRRRATGRSPTSHGGTSTGTPALKELIAVALANGYDARIAAARVEESRAIAAQVHGQLFPGIGYEANADRGRNAVLGNPSTQGASSVSNGFDGYLGAAWEFDLWGRVRRLDEAARSQYLATEDARRGVLLSLVSDVATAYYELLELDEELAIAREATTVLRREPQAVQPAARGRRRRQGSTPRAPRPRWRQARRGSRNLKCRSRSRRTK